MFIVYDYYLLFIVSYFLSIVYDLVFLFYIIAHHLSFPLQRRVNSPQRIDIITSIVSTAACIKGEHSNSSTRFRLERSCNGMVQKQKGIYTKSTIGSPQKIILHQRTHEIPDKPPVELPERNILPTLGEKTATLSRIEENYNNQSEEFETAGQNLRVERELAGIGDRYSQMQPLSMPVVNKN